MDLVVSDDGVATRSDLYPGQRVAVDVVVLQNTTSASKEVHAPLEATEDLVVSQCRIALAGDPNSGIGVGKDLVFDELTTPLCMCVCVCVCVCV